MLFRRAVPADVPALVEVQRQGALLGLGHIFPQASHPFPRALIVERWLEELADPAVDVWILCDDDGITGFAATTGDELLHFGTAPATWGSGLASDLLGAVLRAAADQGRPLTRLWVFEANTRARRFYEKHGWQATGALRRGTTSPHPSLLEYQRLAIAGQP